MSVLRQAIALLVSASFLLVQWPVLLTAADTDNPAADAAQPDLVSVQSVKVGDNQVEVLLSRPAKYNTFTTANPPRIVLDILDSSVSLTTRDYAGRGSNLKRVRAGQFQGEPDPISRVVLDLRRLGRYTVTPEANALLVKIEDAPVGAETAQAPPTQPSSGTDASSLELSPTPGSQAQRFLEKPVAEGELNGMATQESALAGSAAAPSTALAPEEMKSEPPPRDIMATLSKERVSLDFQDTDISDVLKLLGAKANINVIYGPDVTGTLTIHLNDVPFNEAFSIILGLKNLMMFQVGENTIRIVTAPELQKERTATIGLTRVFPLGYTDATTMKTQVDAVRVLEKRTGQTVADLKDNALIVTDTPEGLDSAERLIKSLDARPQQVLIETKLVEVDLSKSFALGIQWSYFDQEPGRIGGQTGTNYIGGAPTLTGPTITQPLDNASNINFQGTPAVPIGAAGQGTGVALPASQIFGALTLGRVTNSYLLSATLTAAAAKGKVKVLSDPKISTLNNKPATVTITTSIPYATSNISATGAATTTVNNVSVGVTLTVTPTINADGRISLHVTPNISKPSSTVATGTAASTGVIAVDTRQVDTNVMVRDGETIVIGGLITDSLSDTEAGIPFLQDIPLIGWLFKNKSVSRTRSELLIFVTTKILQD